MLWQERPCQVGPGTACSICLVTCYCSCLPPRPPACLQTINDFGRKARDGTLSIDEMAGGTYTIRWAGLGWAGLGCCTQAARTALCTAHCQLCMLLSIRRHPQPDAFLSVVSAL